MKKSLKMVIPVVLVIILALTFSACAYHGNRFVGRNLAPGRNWDAGNLSATRDGLRGTRVQDGYGKYNLYFANDGYNQLTTESRQYRRDWSRNPNSVKMAEEALGGLISGPRDRNLRSTINPRARVNSVTLNNGVMAVDLRDGIIDGHNDLGTRSSMAANSIINSLRVLPGVREVRVTDNGSAIYANDFPTVNNRALAGRTAGRNRNALISPLDVDVFDGTVGRNNFDSTSKRFTSDNNRG